MDVAAALGQVPSMRIATLLALALSLVTAGASAQSGPPRAPRRPARGGILIEAEALVGMGQPPIGARFGFGFAKYLGPGLSVAAGLVGMPFAPYRFGGERQGYLASGGVFVDACGGMGAGSSRVGGCLGLLGELAIARDLPLRGTSGDLAPLVSVRIGGFVELGGRHRLRIRPDLVIRAARPKVEQPDGLRYDTPSVAGFGLSLSYVGDVF